MTNARAMRTIAAALGLLAVAGAALAETGVIRGAASHSGTLDLRPGTVLEVELLDVSKADAPAERRGSVSVPVRRLGPIPFVLSYDPAAIEAGSRYSVAARLVQDGLVIQRNDGANPVLTGGAGNTVDIELVPLDTPEAAVAVPGPAALAGTWALADIGGAAATEGVESVLTLTAEGEAQGRGGCNGFRGTFTPDGEGLTLGPVAATRRACPPPQMQQETRFFAALEATRAFRVEDARLVLLDAAGNPVATLVRRE